MTDLAFLVETTVLVALSVTLLSVVARYAHNVMHTRAVILLAVTLLLFTLSSVVEHLLGMALAGEVLHVGSDLTFLWAFWLFAREFVLVEERELAPVETSVEGGFEDAHDD